MTAKLFLTTLILFLIFAPSTVALAEVYKKATDLEEIVLEKLYPKSGRLEVNADLGIVLNQAFVDTTLIRVSASYYLTESWGLAFSAIKAQNKDKEERLCIESFYNDPDKELSNVCASQDNTSDIESAKKANMGPAYMPIREIEDIFLLESVFSPNYGKQIFFLGVVSHFDFQIKLGAGLARSTYYEQRNTIKGDPSKPARGAFSDEKPDTNPGVSHEETYKYGTAGRPDPIYQTNAVLAPALVQKFYVADRFSWNAELGSLFILGTPGGFEYLLTISTGVSVRF
jgi:hypothetical protein